MVVTKRAVLILNLPCNDRTTFRILQIKNNNKIWC
jgi:hypothetical protein